MTKGKKIYAAFLYLLFLSGVILVFIGVTLMVYANKDDAQSESFIKDFYTADNHDRDIIQSNDAEKIWYWKIGIVSVSTAATFYTIGMAFGLLLIFIGTGNIIMALGFARLEMKMSVLAKKIPDL